jgi:type II secretory pathway component PulJ
MNNWTLQMMQQKNQIIKKQAERIEELEAENERLKASLTRGEP